MNTQLKKGTLELVILKLISENEAYGYQIGKYISREIEVHEGTTYLILQRLEKNGYLKSTLKSEANSKRRKYYTLTDEGITYKKQLLTEWNKLSEFIDSCSLSIRSENE